MNYYSLLPLSGLIAGAVLFILVLYRNRKASLNRTYALFALFIGVYSLFNFLNFNSPTAEVAYFWEKTETLGITIAIAFLFHFSLIFTKVDEKRRKYFALSVYILSISIVAVHFTTNLITDHMELAYWGYNVVPGILGHLLFVPYIFCTIVLSLLLFLRFLRSTKSAIEKKQAKIIFFGILVPLITGTLTDLLPEVTGEYIMPLGSGSTAIMSAFIAYAMLKYRLMTLTPSLAAENIIKTMADYLLVINRDRTVAFLSDSALDALKYRNKNQLSEKLRETFPEKMFDTVIDRIEKENYMKDLDTTLRTKEGKSIPVSLNGSIIKGSSGETLGYVLIMRDMSKIAELIKSLQERTAELEKSKKELEKSKKELEMKVGESEMFNKLAVGRELKMVEMKKRIRELEGNT